MNKTAVLTIIVSLASAAPTASADNAWQADFRRADLNDSGGLSTVELGKTNAALLKPVRDNFKSIDADHDGHVTMGEYEHYLAKRDDDFAERFRKADLNDSGGLSQKELGKITGGDFDVMKKHFSAIDADRDGHLTLREYETFRSAPAKASTTAASSPPRDGCRPNCGTVVAIDRYKIEGEGSPIGAVAGGVVGGLLGNQIGGGKGKTVATVGGAAGGAYAGYQIEKRMKTEKRVKVTVKFDNGTQKDFDYEAEESPFPRGARVQLKDGQLTAYTGS